MTRLLPACLLCLLLPACMTLPGSDTSAPSRYMLQGPGGACDPGEKPLALSVVKVSAGLNTDRIARREERSGEYTYLKGVRWVDQAGAMLEQRLAADLECRGYTVLTSHHHKLSHDQMICEVRALNLVDGAGSNEAEVGLSCVYFRAGDTDEVTLRAYHRSRLRSWSADNAVAATSDAYQQVLSDILDALP